MAIFESLFLITDPLYNKPLNEKTLNVYGESAGWLLENGALVKFVNLIYNIKSFLLEVKLSTYHALIPLGL